MQNPSGSSAARPQGGTRARAPLKPLPQGVCSLLGRAGEARSGFCREVKRRDAESSISGNRRRLSSRRVPDCLRGPTGERAHTRNPATPDHSPPHQSQHPTDSGIPLRGKGLPAAPFDLETRARPANATGGWVVRRNGRREAAAHTPTTTPTRQGTTPQEHSADHQCAVGVSMTRAPGTQRAAPLFAETCREEVSTASKSEPVRAESAESSSLFQRWSWVPLMYQAEPLSATIAP